jgi:hypothetical protein
MNAGAMASGVCIIDHPCVSGDVMEKAKDVMSSTPYSSHSISGHCSRKPKPIPRKPQIANRLAKEVDAKATTTKIPRRTSMRMGYDFRFGLLGPGQH